MAATKIAVVYDTITGNRNVLRVPDDDSELDDPSLNYPGTTKVKILLSDFISNDTFPMNVSDFGSLVVPGSSVVTPVVIASQPVIDPGPIV